MVDYNVPLEFAQVTVTCEAEVAGQRIAVSQNVAAQAWADHQLRATIEEMVRRKLLDEIMERWKPAIRVRE